MNFAGMGIPYEEVAGTGTIATLKGKEDQPVIGLRCDIDALPIREVKNLPYCSQNQGVMHACGHDAHISMLLTAARVLAEHQDELKCTVKLIFQPAEELDQRRGKGAGVRKGGKAGYGGGHAHIPVPGERHHLRGSRSPLYIGFLHEY